MTDQLALFDVTFPAPPGAAPLGDAAEACGRCGFRALPYGVMRLVGPLPGEVTYRICLGCTVHEVRDRRSRGDYVPPGYGWVP